MSSDEDRIVWSSESGDLRKKKQVKEQASVDETQILLEVRRLVSGKGRTVIEITGLPAHKKWNQKLAQKLKKALGVGGAFKKDFIEIHGEKLDEVGKFLDDSQIKWKKTGG